MPRLWNPSDLSDIVSTAYNGDMEPCRTQHETDAGERGICLECRRIVCTACVTYCHCDNDD